MDNRSAKLSELPAANALSNTCLLYMVDSSGESKSVNVATLVQYIIDILNG
jgi:hypothetical protein